MLHKAALLTAEESRAADKSTIDGGIGGETLMERAGNAVAEMIALDFTPRPLLVICGTGNNGGDGFVVARLLKQRGWEVVVGLIGDERAISTGATIMRDKWGEIGGKVEPFSPHLLDAAKLIIDAIFGTGLSRALEGAAKDAVIAINASSIPVIAIDIASGIDADSGKIMGVAIEAAHTVTFTRPKPGHVLLPGKSHTGELYVADIGIETSSIQPKQFLNLPELWRQNFPLPGVDSHKYTRGHALVIGGGIETTGATRLAAIAALRGGAGLVTVACTPETLPVYAPALTAVMTRVIKKPGDLDTLLEDKRITATLIGPGYGITETTRETVLQILKHKKAAVLDADAISAFKENRKTLLGALHDKVVLTPHEGEFSRLFTLEGTKTVRAREAAKLSNAVIVLKGHDTVVAHPDGRIAINANAPVWLATAGSGDVLAGIITALLAQGMPAFDAACAAVWMHGDAASQFGPGLISEDIEKMLPQVFQKLLG